MLIRTHADIALNGPQRDALVFVRPMDSATFGDIVRLGGTPSDAVLDEGRGRITSSIRTLGE